jgi:hypothetical protein
VSFVSDTLRLFGNPPYTPSHRYSTLLQLNNAVLARFLLPHVLSRTTEVSLLVFLAFSHIRSCGYIAHLIPVGRKLCPSDMATTSPCSFRGPSRARHFCRGRDATYWFPSDTSPLKGPRSSVMQAIHRRAFTMRRTLSFTSELAMGREGELFL